ncbi:MAG TPA: LysE family translocator [Candidatus Nanopelagicaceae bacterium]|nr:LysE family translocator [Candidatus Nanopelagicaceae bacterium]
MPPRDHLLAFVIASTAIILLPGPSVLFTIARAVSWGRRIAVATVVGNNLGALVTAMLVAIGVGPLLQHSMLLYVAIQIAGGGYLIWLGIGAWRLRSAHANQILNAGDVAPSMGRTIREGFIVGLLNPKSFVFYAAIFPQFIDRSRNVVTQMMVLGLIFVVIAFFSDSTWGILAGTARTWLSSAPSRLVTMRAIGSSVMTGLGIYIILTVRRH